MQEQILERSKDGCQQSRLSQSGAVAATRNVTRDGITLRTASGGRCGEIHASSALLYASEGIRIGHVQGEETSRCGMSKSGRQASWPEIVLVGICVTGRQNPDARRVGAISFWWAFVL